jgi:hypothetical protein
MTANFRIRLALKLAVGPLHPTGQVDVFLTLHPSLNGSAGVEITNVEWQGNLAYTAVARLLKGTLAEIINTQIREALLKLPQQIPQVEEVRILEIN